MANKHLLNGVIKSEPKGWSDEEISKMLELKKQGLSFDDIGKMLGRTAYSCNRKYYKLMKKLDTYNDKHRDLKYGFDFALQIAQKGLVITFGEIVGRRFNRQDFVEHRYGMNYIEDFTTHKLSEYVIKRALIYRKILTPIIKAEMTNISRVYYKIEHFDYGNSGCKYFHKKETINLFS